MKYTARAGEDTSALEVSLHFSVKREYLATVDVCKTAFEGCVDVPRRANNAIALSMLVTKEVRSL